MIDLSDSSRHGLRVSDAEREEAVRTLGLFVSEGRLSESELMDRSAAARAAVTRGDLVPLFADLPDRPEDDDESGAPSAALATSTPPLAGGIPPAEALVVPDGETASAVSTRPGSRSWRTAVLSVTPVAAFGLFFATGFAGNWGTSWLWFLAVPIVTAIVRAGDTDDEGERRRRRDRRD